MKKTLKILLAILLVSTLVLTLTACTSSPCEHEWQLKSETAATCLAPGGKLYECTKCGITRHEGIAQLPHTPVAMDGQPATCKDTGLDGGTKCADCGRILTAQEATALLPHTFETTTTAATCTTDGSIVSKCSVCGITITEVIPAAHTWDEGVVILDATCYQTGLRLFTCTVCQETMVDTIAMAEHKLIWCEATAEAIAHYHCNICGKNFDENKNEITDLTPGETPVDPTWALTKAALVEEDGKVYFVYSGTYAGYKAAALEEVVVGELKWTLVRPSDWETATEYDKIFAAADGAWSIKVDITVGAINGFIYASTYYIDYASGEMYDGIWTIGESVELGNYKYEFVDSYNGWGIITFRITDKTPAPVGEFVFGEEGIADANPGNMYYWNDQNWCGSNVTVSKHTVQDGVYTFEYSGATTACWFGAQLFYENAGNEAGKEYTVSFVMESSVAGSIKVNGTVVPLQAGINNISVNYVEPTDSGKASLSIQFGTDTPVSVIAGGTFVLKEIAFKKVGGDVPANKYGTAENPLSIEQALALAKEECPADTNVTAEMVYAKGVVKSVGTYGSYLSNVYVTDVNNSSIEMLIFSINLSSGVETPYQNDTIVFYGYIKNYKGTLEFATNDGQYVYAIETIRGQSAITVGSHDGATVTGLAASALNGSTVTFTVTPVEGKEIVAVRVNGKSITGTNGQYSFTMQGPATVTVETKDAGTETPQAYYQKVTSIESGKKYLIVYEKGNLILDGSRSTASGNKIDAEGNIVSNVAIDGDKIPVTDAIENSYFTIEVLSDGRYSIKSAAGEYIGSTASGSNTLSASTSTAYANTITFDASGNVVIEGQAGSRFLRYNNAAQNGTRFRYYAATSQQAIQLYMLVEEQSQQPTGKVTGIDSAAFDPNIISLYFNTENLTVEQLKAQVELVINGQGKAPYEVNDIGVAGRYNLKFDGIYALAGTTAGTYTIQFKLNGEVIDVAVGGSGIAGAQSDNGYIYTLAVQDGKLTITVSTEEIKEPSYEATDATLAIENEKVYLVISGTYANYDETNLRRTLINVYFDLQKRGDDWYKFTTFDRVAFVDTGAGTWTLKIDVTNQELHANPFTIHFGADGGAGDLKLDPAHAQDGYNVSLNGKKYTIVNKHGSGAEEDNWGVVSLKIANLYTVNSVLTLEAINGKMYVVITGTHEYESAEALKAALKFDAQNPDDDWSYTDLPNFEFTESNGSFTVKVDISSLANGQYFIHVGNGIDVGNEDGIEAIEAGGKSYSYVFRSFGDWSRYVLNIADAETPAGPTSDLWMVVGSWGTPDDHWNASRDTWDWIFSADNNYTLTMDFVAGNSFKFKQNDGGWDNQIYYKSSSSWTISAASGVTGALSALLTQDGGDDNSNFGVNYACKLQFTYNPETNTVAILVLEAELPALLDYYLTGVFNGVADWNDHAKFDWNAELEAYQITISFAAADQWKIKLANSWDWQIGNEIISKIKLTYAEGLTQPASLFVTSETNIKVEYACTITITLIPDAANASNSTVSVHVTAIDVVERERDLYLAGGMNSWSTNNAAYKFVYSDGTYTLKNVAIASGQEFKLVYDGTWMGVKDLTIKVTGASYSGSDNISLNTAGNYDLMFNPTTSTLTITPAVVEHQHTYTQGKYQDNGNGTHSRMCDDEDFVEEATEQCDMQFTSNTWEKHTYNCSKCGYELTELHNLRGEVFNVCEECGFEYEEYFLWFEGADETTEDPNLILNDEGDGFYTIEEIEFAAPGRFQIKKNFAGAKGEIFSLDGYSIEWDGDDCGDLFTIEGNTIIVKYACFVDAITVSADDLLIVIEMSEDSIVIPEPEAVVKSMYNGNLAGGNLDIWFAGDNLSVERLQEVLLVVNGQEMNPTAVEPNTQVSWQFHLFFNGVGSLFGTEPGSYPIEFKLNDKVLTPFEEVTGGGTYESDGCTYTLSVQDGKFVVVVASAHTHDFTGAKPVYNAGTETHTLTCTAAGCDQSEGYTKIEDCTKTGTCSCGHIYVPANQWIIVGDTNGTSWVEQTTDSKFIFVYDHLTATYSLTISFKSADKFQIKQNKQGVWTGQLGGSKVSGITFDSGIEAISDLFDISSGDIVVKYDCSVTITLTTSSNATPTAMSIAVHSVTVTEVKEYTYTFYIYAPNWTTVGIHMWGTLGTGDWNSTSMVSAGNGWWKYTATSLNKDIAGAGQSVIMYNKNSDGQRLEFGDSKQVTLKENMFFSYTKGLVQYDTPQETGAPKLPDGFVTGPQVIGTYTGMVDDESTTITLYDDETATWDFFPGEEFTYDQSGDIVTLYYMGEQMIVIKVSTDTFVAADPYYGLTFTSESGVTLTLDGFGTATLGELQLQYELIYAGTTYAIARSASGEVIGFRLIVSDEKSYDIEVKGDYETGFYIDAKITVEGTDYTFGTPEEEPSKELKLSAFDGKEFGFASTDAAGSNVVVFTPSFGNAMNVCKIKVEYNTSNGWYRVLLSGQYSTGSAFNNSAYNMYEYGKTSSDRITDKEALAGQYSVAGQKSSAAFSLTFGQDEDGKLTITFTLSDSSSITWYEVSEESQPEHECTSKCPDCQGCLNANCQEAACQNKCLGHESHDNDGTYLNEAGTTDIEYMYDIVTKIVLDGNTMSLYGKTGSLIESATLKWDGNVGKGEIAYGDFDVTVTRDGDVITVVFTYYRGGYPYTYKFTREGAEVKSPLDDYQGDWSGKIEINGVEYVTIRINGESISIIDAEENENGWTIDQIKAGDQLVVYFYKTSTIKRYYGSLTFTSATTMTVAIDGGNEAVFTLGGSEQPGPGDDWNTENEKDPIFAQDFAGTWQGTLSGEVWTVEVEERAIYVTKPSGERLRAYVTGYNYGSDDDIMFTLAGDDTIYNLYVPYGKDYLELQCGFAYKTIKLSREGEEEETVEPTDGETIFYGESVRSTSGGVQITITKIAIDITDVASYAKFYCTVDGESLWVKAELTKKSKGWYEGPGAGTELYYYAKIQVIVNGNAVSFEMAVFSDKILLCTNYDELISDGEFTLELEQPAGKVTGIDSIAFDPNIISLYFNTENLTVEQLKAQVELVINGQGKAPYEVNDIGVAGRYNLKFDGIYALAGTTAETYTIQFKLNGEVIDVAVGGSGIIGTQKDNGNVYTLEIKDGQLVITVAAEHVHSYSEGRVQDNGDGTHSRMCDAEDYVEEVKTAHVYTEESIREEITGDKVNHAVLCDVCGNKDKTEGHEYIYVEDDDAVHLIGCEGCSYVDEADHTFVYSCENNAEMHTITCSANCGYSVEAAHTPVGYKDNEDGSHSYTCRYECGYTASAPHDYNSGDDGCICGAKEDKGTSVTMSYSGDTTGNIKNDQNYASMVGLDANVFDIRSTTKTGQSQYVGINKAGQIRLYATATTSENGYLHINIADGCTITKIAVTLASGSPAGITYLKVVVGDVTVSGTDGVYAINGKSITLSNTGTGQMYIASIVITYTGTPTTDPGTETPGPEVTPDPEGPVTVEISKFTDIEGDLDANIHFKAEKGNAGTAPGVYSEVIRVYQNGGLFTITAKNDKKITSITIGSSMGTTVKYKVDSAAEVTGQGIAANAKLTLSDLSATTIVFTCMGTTSSTRLYVNYLQVTYE